MPVYNFKCASCGATPKKLLTPSEAKEDQPCTSCGALLCRDVRGPSVRVVERLDNGLMPKTLERLADAEHITAEHAKSKDKER